MTDLFKQSPLPTPQQQEIVVLKCRIHALEVDSLRLKKELQKTKARIKTQKQFELTVLEF